MDNKVFETYDISEAENKSISFLYKTLPGRVLLRLLIKPILSGFFGFIMDRGISKPFISRLTKSYGICLDDYKDVKYKSFNDFFTRELKEGSRPISANPSDVISPCDAKLTAYPITSESVFLIKNSAYSVKDMLRDEQLAKKFDDGVCLIYRLMPDDYHRYCHIDDGNIVSHKKIKGVLHTVRPIAFDRYNVYKENAREYSVLQTRNFGKVIQMEVGALFVGRIINHKTDGAFSRGEEKGMFEFGGSTIVMLFQKNTVSINNTIFENTQNDKETIVKQGYIIGEKVL